MAITKMTGRTYDMLVKDKRVETILRTADPKVTVRLNAGWESGGRTASIFDNWEAARNWVRKAVKVEA